MKVKLKNIIIFIVTIIVSTLLSIFEYTEDSIISDSNFILTTLVTFFSIALAIVALLFTVLDRYKDSTANIKLFIHNSSAILKEISSGTIFIFILIIVMIVFSVFQPLTDLISVIDIYEIASLCTLMLALAEMFDITLSIHLLVSNLKDNVNANEKDFGLTLKERNLVEAYRMLDPEHASNINEQIKKEILEQEYRKNTNKKEPL